MYSKVLDAVKEALSKAKTFTNDNPEDIEELQKALRSLKHNMGDGLPKTNEHGQWSLTKAVKPIANIGAAHKLSEKHNGEHIPENHPDRKVMVNHINTILASGNNSEARRLHDLHISGGGSYSKGFKD